MTEQRCKVCRQLMDRPSMYGICQRYRDCKSAYHKAEGAKRRASNMEGRNSLGRTCSVCGGPVGDKSRSGICGNNPKCRASIQRRRAAKPREERHPAFDGGNGSQRALRAMHVTDRVRIVHQGGGVWAVLLDGKPVGYGTADQADAAAARLREQLRAASDAANGAVAV